MKVYALEFDVNYCGLSGAPEIRGSSCVVAVFQNIQFSSHCHAVIDAKPHM
jgi:hypothetical protein